MKAALNFPSYALVDILQPCVAFNKLNTYGWYKKRTYIIENHDPEDWEAALTLARTWGDRIPLGIFYNVPCPTYDSKVPALQGEPLSQRIFNPEAMAHIQDEFI